MIILSICLSSTLLLIISLFFSSAHNFMIKEISKDKPYHVAIRTTKFDKPNYIKKLIFKDGEALIEYEKVKDTYKNTDLLCKKIKCQNVQYNESLLSLYGVSKKENILSSFKKLLITVFSILSIGVFILITNAFNISLTEQKKQIASLKSVGMTKWQFLLTLLKEVFIVLIIGIGISLIFSFWLMQLLLVVINYLLADIFDLKFTLVVYPSFLFIALVFIVILVIGSSIVPMIKMNRLSLMEVIRGSDEFKSKKIPHWAKKFNTTKKLAFCNYYRSKRKNLVVTFCIFAGFSLYTTFSLYLEYGIKTINSYSAAPEYDFEVVSTGSNESYAALENLGQKFEKYKLFKSCTLQGRLAIDSYLDKNDYSDSKQILVIENDKEEIINRIIEVREKENRLIKENRKFLKTEVILDLSGEKKVKTTNEIAWGLTGLLNGNNIVFLTNNFDNYCPKYTVNLFIKGDSDEALTSLQKIDNFEASYVDVKKAMKLKNNLLLVIKICLYMFVILVSLIGVSSMINTIQASFNLRAKEFGLLFSMGLTKKQLNKMLIFESLFMLVKAFLLAIPLILVIDLILYNSLNMVFDVSIIWPFKELLIYFVCSLFVIYLCLKSSYRVFYTNEITTMIANDNV